jgi:hypothetical protein
MPKNYELFSFYFISSEACFHRSKRQLKNLPFIHAFCFSVFLTEKPIKKQEQVRP